MRATTKLPILICLLLIAGLLGRAQAATVRVAVPTLSMVVIAFTAAKERGYYRDEGLDVDLVQMRDTLGISALIGGNVDFASMSGAGMTAMVGGVPLRFVYSTFFRPMFWLYAKPEFRRPESAQRQTHRRHRAWAAVRIICCAKCSSATASKAGETRRSWLWVCRRPWRPRLRNGVVDAGMISPPFNFIVRDAGFRELVSFLKEDFVELQGSILVNDKFLQSDPGVVEKFVRGTVKGLRYARENKAGTIAILLRYMKLKEDLAGQYYDQVRPIMTTDGTVNVDMQKKYLDQALKVLNPKEAPTVEKLYSYGLARKVNAELDAAGWKPGR